MFPFLSLLIALISPPTTEDSVLIWQGEMASISVEKCLYESQLSNHFFLRYTLHNLTTQPLGVDLSDEDNLFHPNQWGVHSEPKRFIIDERTIDYSHTNCELKKRMKKAWGREDLTLIPAGGSVDYYRDFNASDKAEVVGQLGEFLIVTSDGEIFFFDNRHYEMATKYGQGSITETDVAMPFPVTFKPIPADAKVLMDM